MTAFRVSFALGLALALSLATGPCARAQEPPSSGPPDTAGSYVDAGAALLLERARSARERTDRSVASYTAVVRGRIAGGLRTPLKDRTLFRQETAARVRWSRDGENVVQMLAAREQAPDGVSVPHGLPFPMDNLFDPSNDRFYFGSMPVRERRSDDDFWIEHPLGRDAERHYRFASGDTLTVRLQDGRSVRTVELRVTPRRSDPHTVRGTLWIDMESGALVQSAFRLARVVNILRDLAMDDDEVRRAARVPLINPMEFDISLLTVEYGLWEMQHWLPRSMRFDGMIRVGVFRAPASADISYRMLDVEIDAPGAPRTAEAEEAAVQRTIAAWSGDGDLRETRTTSNRRHYRVLRPSDAARLLEGDDLPPPIWVDAPGFATSAELQELYDRVASTQGPIHAAGAPHLGWGFGEPDMVRYNRVEALSVGARLTAPLPFATASATVRLGAGDLHPNAELSLRRETMRRTVELRGYHELATVDESRRAFGLGNSFSSLLLGRDEGEYFRATGGALSLRPPADRRQWWEARVHAERHDDVARNTHVALPRAWTDSVFRPNIVADEASQYGIMLLARPWWGSDPHAAQLGVAAMLQAETGDFQHVRGRITLRGAVPLGGRVRVGAELGAGTTEGDAPVQRNFFLGGAATLRGYEPATVSGTSMARGRLELARTYGFGGLAVFTDWGWAGDRDAIREDQQRWAVGTGASILDGLIRIDLARALRQPRGWRLDLHVDALM
jgi:hypothetical protein